MSQYVEYYDPDLDEWVTEYLQDDPGASYEPVQLDPVTNDPGVSRTGLGNDVLDQAWNGFETSGQTWEDLTLPPDSGHWYDGFLDFLSGIEVSSVVTRPSANQGGGAQQYPPGDPRNQVRRVATGGGLNSTSMAYLGLAGLLLAGGFLAGKHSR